MRGRVGMISRTLCPVHRSQLRGKWPQDVRRLYQVEPARPPPRLQLRLAAWMLDRNDKAATIPSRPNRKPIRAEATAEAADGLGFIGNPPLGSKSRFRSGADPLGLAGSVVRDFLITALYRLPSAGPAKARGYTPSGFFALETYNARQVHDQSSSGSALNLFACHV